MDALTVFLAPDGAASGVRDVLRDLSTAGLVAPFLWVREAAVLAARDDGRRIPAVRVADGRLTGTTLMSEVNKGRYGLVRLCSVVPLAGGPTRPSPVEPELVHQLRSAAGGLRVVPVRCLLAAPGDTGPDRVLARDGWHNMLVSPEDSRGPNEPYELLPRATGPVELARHAGPVMAGLLGLWTGMVASCLDELPVPPERQVRLIRAFYRRVDASDVEARLRERTLTTAVTPLPQEHGAVAVHAPDPADAADTMVTALCRKHPEVLPRERAQVPQVTLRKIGWRESLRWFFGFLWAAVRNAPEDWFRARKSQLAGTAARSVQRTVFGGSTSAYRVIVDQRGPDGRPAAWYDLREASARVVEGMHGRPQHVVGDLSDLWRDFAAGALTLVDGGERDRQLPPIRVGNQLGVLRSAQQSVPDGLGDFTVTSAQVQGRTETPSVQASDVRGSATFRDRLAPLAPDPRVPDANRMLAAFDDWRREHSGSYSVRFGQVLSRGIDRTLDEIDGFVRQLDQLGADGGDDELGAQRRSVRAARWATLAALVAVLVVGGLWTIGQADGTTALVAAGVVLLVWAVAGTLSFVQGQRLLFQALTSQSTTPAQRATIEANLRAALEDLQRLTEAYGQFLVWSRVVGAVVNEPFTTTRAAHDDRVSLRRGLPLSTALGRARVDETPLAEVAGHLRRGVFTPGWLSAPWDDAVSRAAARLGPRGHDLGDAEGAVFALPSGPDSLLEEWADRIVRDRPFASTGGDRAWRTCKAEIDAGAADGDGLAQRLVVLVDPEDRSGGRPVPRDEFMAGIDDRGVHFSSATHRARGGRPAVLTEASRFAGANRGDGAMDRSVTEVTDSVPSGPRSGLSRTAVLVQLGSPAPVQSFAVFAPREPGETDDAALTRDRSDF